MSPSVEYFVLATPPNILALAEVHQGLGVWAGAIATFFAAVAALILGLRVPKPKLALVARFAMYQAGKGISAPTFEYRVINKSATTQVVSGLGYSTGWLRWRKNHFTRFRGNMKIAELPFSIDPFSARVSRAVGPEFTGFIGFLVNDWLKEPSYLTRSSFRFTAVLATGQVLLFKPEPEFWEKLHLYPNGESVPEVREVATP